MNITITIKTDGKTDDDIEDKLKKIRQPQETTKLHNLVDSKTIEMMQLLKKRLDRHAEPIGG